MEVQTKHEIYGGSSIGSQGLVRVSDVHSPLLPLLSCSLPLFPPLSLTPILILVLRFTHVRRRAPDWTSLGGSREVTQACVAWLVRSRLVCCALSRLRLARFIW